METYGLSAYDAAVLSVDREKAEFFESVAKGRDGKLCVLGLFFICCGTTVKW